MDFVLFLLPSICFLALRLCCKVSLLPLPLGIVDCCLLCWGHWFLLLGHSLWFNGWWVVLRHPGIASPVLRRWGLLYCPTASLSFAWRSVCVHCIRLHVRTLLSLSMSSFLTLQFPTRKPKYTSWHRELLAGKLKLFSSFVQKNWFVSINRQVRLSGLKC